MPRRRPKIRPAIHPRPLPAIGYGSATIAIAARTRGVVGYAAEAHASIAVSASALGEHFDELGDEEEVLLALASKLLVEERARSGRRLSARFVYGWHGRVERLELVEEEAA